MKNNIKTLIGLFVPVKFYDFINGKNYWGFTMSIGGIPLGWLIIGISLLVKFF